MRAGEDAPSPARQAGGRGPHAPRKDLKDLRDLPRSALHAYQRKYVEPGKPRSRAAAAQRPPYPTLGAFAPRRFWRWMSEYWRFRIGRRHPFLTYESEDGDNGVYALRGEGGEVRIALAGDWGTGADDAAHVAASSKPGGRIIRSISATSIMSAIPRKWARTSLGSPIRAAPTRPANGLLDRRARSRSTAIMRCMRGTTAIFDHILPKLGVRGGRRGQHASYFCLENGHWRIVALDTGYNSVGAPIVERLIQPDCALRPELIDWLRNVVKPRSDDPRGIVILSHQQYVSRFDHCYPKPARQLMEFFFQPVLWLWGHERRLAIYREAAVEGGVAAFGRCIGHGGMPVDLPPKAPLHDFAVEFVDDRVYPNDEHLPVGFSGFARMTLRDDKLKLDYVDVKGTRVFSETWTIDQASSSV